MVVYFTRKYVRYVACHQTQGIPQQTGTGQILLSTFFVSSVILQLLFSRIASVVSSIYCCCPLQHLLLSSLPFAVHFSFCCPRQLLLSLVASVVLGSFCCPWQLLLSSVASVVLGSFCCPRQFLLSSVASVVLSSFCCPWQLLLSLVASVVLGSFQVSSLTPIFVSLQFLLLSRLVSSFYYCLLFVM